MSDFLFELGCEELPSGAVWTLADSLSNQMREFLEKAQLQYGQMSFFATPRRLALFIEDLQEEQPTQQVSRRGPALAAAFDTTGNPTPALLGFAKSCSVSVDELSRLETDKGAWMVYETQISGSLTKDLLPNFISQAIKNLPIAKPMRWGAGDDEFARPVHWAIMLFNEHVIECNILGITTGRESIGHRFHHPQKITIESAKSYVSQMQEAFVIADFSKRKELIKSQVEQLAASYEAEAIMPEDLLDEVTSIVEWPQALIANFAKEFLEVPAEALIASMQAHQKCFALRNKKGELLPHFITVANIASLNPPQVVAGNEKVMRARLSDAAFFYQQDKKRSLFDLKAATENVVFQNQLGTLQDKALRIEKLMQHLSGILNLSQQSCIRAAQLSKCDLLTGMVGEFPELQGLMGYYYALHDGEEKAVAIALDEQYMPRFAADELPSTDLGVALSLADRIDTLVGIFAIGQKPSGAKDPFKLRRHALAVVRLLVSLKTPLSLDVLLKEAALNYESRFTIAPAVLEELKTFIFERLSSYYQARGISLDRVLAVRACEDNNLEDLDKRIQALQTFINLPQAVFLSAACKRVNNILSHANMDNDTLIIQDELFQEEAEKALYRHIQQVQNEVAPLYQEAHYRLVLERLAGLKEPVDAFFDTVMVMVDDASLKTNRLALLVQLQALLKGVADISLLQLA